MQIPPRRGHAAMAERRLHQVDRCAAVEGVRGMRMAQPVRRYGGRQTSPGRGRLHDPMHLGRIQRAALGGANTGASGLASPRSCSSKRHNPAPPQWHSWSHCDLCTTLLRGDVALQQKRLLARAFPVSISPAAPLRRCCFFGRFLPKLGGLHAGPPFLPHVPSGPSAQTGRGPSNGRRRFSMTSVLPG